MNHIARVVIGAFVGTVIGVLSISLFDTLNSALFPATQLNPTFSEQVQDIKSASVGELLMMLLGYSVSSFLGGYVAARIAHHPKQKLAAFCVGFFFLLGGIVFFLSLPYPWWLAVSVCISFILFTYLAALVAEA